MMAQDDQKVNYIDLNEFLKSNSSLFVILGVFSALSIYISDLGGGSVGDATAEIRVGFGGSLLLAFLLTLLIYKQLIEQVGSIEVLLKAHTKLYNWDLIVFTTGLLLLLPSMVYPIVQEVVALYYTVGLLMIFFYIMLSFRIVLKIDQLLPENGILRHTSIIALLMIALYISTEYYNYIDSNLQLIGTKPFSTSNMLPVVLDSLAVISVGIMTVSFVSLVYSIIDLLDTLGKLWRDFRSEG